METLKKLTEPIKIGGVLLHTSAVLLLAVAVAVGFWQRLLIAYALAGLHEAAHIAVAKRLGVKLSGVEILPFGVTMRLASEGIPNPDDEIKIALAGPIASIFAAYLAYGIYRFEYRDFIIMTSLVVGIFNMLPVLPLDGGRVFRAVMVKRFGCIRACSYSAAVSKTTAVMIAAAGIFLLYRTGFNFSLILIGGFLIANITEERKNANFVIMKDILYSRLKLAKCGIGDAHLLIAAETERVGKILPRLSYDKYHIISVADKQMKIIRTITETELIEKMAVYGINESIGKIAELRL